jgi:hypothetical protein
MVNPSGMLKISSPVGLMFIYPPREKMRLVVVEFY